MFERAPRLSCVRELSADLREYVRLIHLSMNRSERNTQGPLRPVRKSNNIIVASQLRMCVMCDPREFREKAPHSFFLLVVFWTCERARTCRLGRWSIDELKFSHGEAANCTVNSHSFHYSGKRSSSTGAREARRICALRNSFEWISASCSFTLLSYYTTYYLSMKKLYTIIFSWMWLGASSCFFFFVCDFNNISVPGLFGDKSEQHTRVRWNIC